MAAAHPHETLILGGGPAGTAAAITLACAGEPVLLLEREAESRNKVCGEFLSAEALTLLEGLGVASALGEALPIQTVRMAVGSQCTEVPLPFSARSLTRRSLDDLLLRSACEAGATVLRGKAIERLTPCPTGWQVVLSSGEIFEARRVILATGKHDLRGLPRPAGVQGDLLAMKMYFRLSPGQAQALQRSVELLLHPHGYTGLQPVGADRANLTALVRRAHFSHVGGWAGLFEEIRRGSDHACVRLAGAEPLLARPLALSGIPYGFVRQQALAPGLYAVGDQAAVIPSFTGDGMSLALFSGQLAALAILQREPAEAFQREFYRKVRWQVARATALSQVMVTTAGQRVLTTAARAWPGGMQLAAKLTRLPGVASLRPVEE